MGFGIKLLWQYFEKTLMELLLPVTFKTKKKILNFPFIQNIHEQLNFHLLYLVPKADGQSKLGHSTPSQLSQGSEHYQVLSDMTRKIKGPIFACDLLNDEKHLHFFFPQEQTLSTPHFVFMSGTRQIRNQLKEKVHPIFRSENSQIKRIFLKVKQVGFSPLQLEVRQTCTLYFH